jgi:hypothetical protein
MKKFTQKIHYGYFRECDSLLTVPCPYDFDKCRVGSASCEHNCDNFVEINRDAQYIICSRKPKLLEALEDMVAVAEIMENWANSTTGRQIILKDAQKSISAAYGNQEE